MYLIPVETIPSLPGCDSSIKIVKLGRGSPTKCCGQEIMHLCVFVRISKLVRVDEVELSSKFSNGKLATLVTVENEPIAKLILKLILLL